MHTNCAATEYWTTDDNMWRRWRRNEKSERGESHEDDTTTQKSVAAATASAQCMSTARWAGGRWSAVDDLDEVAAGPTVIGSGGGRHFRYSAASTPASNNRPQPLETMTFRAKRVGRP